MALLYECRPSELRSLEVTFNNILWKILWSLPRACHTGILHQVAGLHSIYNVVVSRSNKLLSTLKSKSLVLIDILLRALPWPLPAWALTSYSVIDTSKVTPIKIVSVLDSSGT